LPELARAIAERVCRSSWTNDRRRRDRGSAFLAFVMGDQVSVAGTLENREFTCAITTAKRARRFLRDASSHSARSIVPLGESPPSTRPLVFLIGADRSETRTRW